ncbi:MAG: leucyl/phenylalanyl-tRNA--protein transferase [Burkholderiaceae bacterium]
MQRTAPIVWIEADQPFPPVAQALGPDSGLSGLLAIGADLSIARLERAYQNGIFPWFSEGQPILWWAPDPRMVLKTADFALSRSLSKTLRRFLASPACEIRVDHDCEAVIRACAQMVRAGRVGTWITAAMEAAYGAGHQAGRVHSFEIWMNGELMGGLYGVNIGRMFFGESMFSRCTDASKWALAALVVACRRRGIEWIDCQQNTRHLASMGAAEVSRTAFLAHLETVVALPQPEEWFYDPNDWKLLDGATSALT